MPSSKSKPEKIIRMPIRVRRDRFTPKPLRADQHLEELGLSAELNGENVYLCILLDRKEETGHVPLTFTLGRPDEAGKLRPATDMRITVEIEESELEIEENQESRDEHLLSMLYDYQLFLEEERVCRSAGRC